MIKDFIKKLKCEKAELGNEAILKALENFDCGNKDDRHYEISCDMLKRFKKHISKEKVVHDVYYIVWDQKNIFLFFSLQSSLVFSTGNVSPDDISKLKEVYTSSQIDQTGYKNSPDTDVFIAQLSAFEELLNKYDTTNDKEMCDLLRNFEKIMRCRAIDKQNNIYVDRIIPSIELVNFCKNYKNNIEWEKVSEGKYPIGAVLFWYNILPIIKDVSNKIGCVYVSIFAADVSDAGTDDKRKLLYYYENALHFKQDVDLNSIKPYYDWECIFLCQKVSELCKYEKTFKDIFLSGFSEDDV